MRLIFIFFFTLGFLLTQKTVAQKYKSPQGYEVAEEIATKMKLGEFENAVKLLSASKGLYPNYDVQAGIKNLREIERIFRSANNSFKKGNISQGIKGYEEATKYKILAIDIAGIVGNQMANHISTITVEQRRALDDKDKDILVRRLSDKARYNIESGSNTLKVAKEDLNQALRIAEGMTDKDLINKIRTEIESLNSVERLSAFPIKGITSTQKQEFDRLYSNLKGSIPKWVVDKRENIEKEFHTTQKNREVAFEKQLEQLANNCDWQKIYSMPEAVNSRFTISEIKGIWEKIIVLQRHNRNDEAIGTAFSSLKSAIQNFPPNVRVALLNCINENHAAVLQNYAKQSVVEKDRLKATDFYNRAESTASSSSTKQALKNEKEKALCDVKLFEQDVQKIVSLMNKCQFGEAESLWNKIVDEPQHCNDGPKVREAYAATGRLLLQKSEENNRYVRLTTVVTSSTRKNSSAVRKALKEIENLEVCDRSEKRAFLSKYKNIERPYIGVGFEGGTIAHWGGRLEIIAPNGIGIFGTLRTSGTQASQILDGTKQKNKTEALIGATLRLTGDLYFNIGGGAGYYSIIHRNDYQNSLFLQKQKYAVAYGGLVGKIGQTMAVNVGASFMNDGNGFYRPEPTLGITFNINKR